MARTATKRGSCLDTFKLYYEDTKTKSKYGLSKEYFKKIEMERYYRARPFHPMGFLIQQRKRFHNLLLLVGRGIKGLMMKIFRKSIDFSNFLCIMKSVIRERIADIKSKFHREQKEKKAMPKSNKNTEAKTKKSVKQTSEKSDRSFLSAIMGIGVALVIVSIAYSTAVIFLGTQGITPKIMLAPQALFAVGVLGYAFTKIFK